MVYRRGSEAECYERSPSAADFGYGRDSEVDIGNRPFFVERLGSFLNLAFRRAQIRNTIEPLCESPIEADLATYLIERFCGFPNVNFVFCSQEDEKQFPDCNVILMPQFKWRRYRADFAFRYGQQGLLMFLECDGKEFHSTPEQLARDRQKDKDCAEASIKMIRLTGSQIYGWHDSTFGLILGAMRQELRGWPI